MDDYHPNSKSHRPFITREDGLFAVDDGGSESRICDAIWHTGNAVRGDGIGACDVIEFLDRTGSRRRALIPHKDTVFRPQKIFEVLCRPKFCGSSWQIQLRSIGEISFALPTITRTHAAARPSHGLA